jgi:hypothetical protein
MPVWSVFVTIEPVVYRLIDDRPMIVRQGIILSEREDESSVIATSIE